MLHYVPMNSHLTGFCNDEAFEVDGREIDKSDFNEVLAQYGYNEYDIESLGYEEIVRLINAKR